MQHTEHPHGCRTEPQSPAEIAGLLDVIGRESETIHRLSGCVEDLREVQAAKQALATVSAAGVRSALEHRCATAGETR